MKIYTLKTCDSCRKAIKWLVENQIPFEEIAIREQPPSLVELDRALQSLDGNIRALFNTSGQEYRSLNLKEKIPTLTTKQALALLAGNGNLVKRPFLVSQTNILVGFNPAIWESQLN